MIVIFRQRLIPSTLPPKLDILYRLRNLSEIPEYTEQRDRTRQSTVRELVMFSPQKKIRWL